MAGSASGGTQAQADIHRSLTGAAGLISMVGTPPFSSAQDRAGNIGKCAAGAHGEDQVGPRCQDGLERCNGLVGRLSPKSTTSGRNPLRNGAFRRNRQAGVVIDLAGHARSPRSAADAECHASRDDIPEPAPDEKPSTFRVKVVTLPEGFQSGNRVVPGVGRRHGSSIRSGDRYRQVMSGRDRKTSPESAFDGQANVGEGKTFVKTTDPR